LFNFSRVTTVSHLLVDQPTPRTISILEIKDGGLAHIDHVREDGDYEADEGTQQPALGAVEQDVDAAPKVLAATQGLDPISVGDAIVNPVS